MRAMTSPIATELPVGSRAAAAGVGGISDGALASLPGGRTEKLCAAAISTPAYPFQALVGSVRRFCGEGLRRRRDRTPSRAAMVRTGAGGSCDALPVVQILNKLRSSSVTAVTRWWARGRPGRAVSAPYSGE